MGRIDLHGVYPEQNNEILPPYLIRGQNDKNEGFTMTHGECQLIYVVHYSK